MIDNKFAINILEQYRERPTLINEIETVEEALWLDEALDMAIKALEKESILDRIRAMIERIADVEQKHDEKWAMGLRYAVKIIDKYRGEVNE